MCNNGSGDIVDHHSDLCIGCGECISACTHGARIGIDDFDAFMADIKKRDRIICIVAPAVAASFNGKYLELNGFLKSIGVEAIFDVSLGAELTVKSYLHYMKKAKPLTVIAQPCPTLVSFIEMYRPELIPYLAPADSPMMHTMKMIKRYYPQYKNHKLAVISPCYSKKREFDVCGLGDYNVTFNSLLEHFRAAGDSVDKYPAVDYDNPSAERAVLFSTPGGLMRTVERYDSDIMGKTRKIEGSPEIYHYLAYLAEAIKKGNAPVFALIDCLNCSMGCNGGPGTANKGKHLDDVEYLVEKRRREMQKRYKPTGFFSKLFGKNKLEKMLDSFWEEGLYTRSYVDRSEVFRKLVTIPSKKQIEDMFTSMHKTEKSDILNCGACGYRSCEQMAVAILNNLNKPQNCRHYDEIEKNLTNAQEAKKMLNKVVDQVLEEMNQNIGGIGELSTKITETADYVMSSSSAIQTMVENVQSIHGTLEHNAETVGKLTESSSDGKSLIFKIVELISNVARQADVLIADCAVIGDIADQTSILGMNAAIEAAHAGETGKGFSVVAGGIRKLSDNSGRQAIKIAKSLKEIKTLIDTSMESSHSAQSQFDAIVSLIGTMKDEAANIRGAMDAQNTGGAQVLKSLQDINALISKVKDESMGLVTSGKSIVEDIDSLKAM
jgi:iron only hydrogenase large subunit-like protein/ArsR family metal-binding transcriptional regulator